MKAFLVFLDDESFINDNLQIYNMQVQREGMEYRLCEQAYDVARTVALI